MFENDKASPGAAKLVVFAGQSNMLGHARATGGAKPFNGRVLAWNNGGTVGQWLRAELGRAPFNERTGAPNSAALHFANRLQRATSGDVYLVGLAVNGATLLSWSSLAAENLARLIGEIERAMASPALIAAGITSVDTFLWHQGESDDAGATMVKAPKLAEPAAYAVAFHGMIEALAAQPWWRPGQTKIIAGELVTNGWLSSRNDFYGDPGRWCSLPAKGVASSQGLGHIGDRAHFDGPALASLGARMFRVWQDLDEKLGRSGTAKADTGLSRSTPAVPLTTTTAYNCAPTPATSSQRRPTTQ